MDNSDSSTYLSYPSVILMDRQLLKACTKGNFSLCSHLILANPDILLSTTPHKNNCLHIATMLGHDEFANEVWSRAPSLFSGINDDGETPLIAALMAANLLLASDIITAAAHYMQHDNLEEGKPLNCMLLKVDRRGESALHHAMRNGFENLALKLLDIEPQLSKQVSNIGESPMYMAAHRGYSRVVERLLQIPSSENSSPKEEEEEEESDLSAAGFSEVVDQLLEIPSSADCGPHHESALYAAVKFNQIGIVEQLLEGRPQLVYHKDKNGNNSLHRAILGNNLELVKIFLDYDPYLAYIKNARTGNTPFIIAAKKGYLSIAKEIMGTSARPPPNFHPGSTPACPDSIYTPDNVGNSTLVHAILQNKPDFIDYILTTPQLHRFINQVNNKGSFPLHHAAEECDPKVLRSLLTHGRLDYTAVDYQGNNAVNVVYEQQALWKTLKWNESFTLLSNVIPSRYKHVISDEAKQTIKDQAIEEVKSLTAKYISNTTLVAALLATITFAAAFTLPGGFSSDPYDNGLPIFARKATFQVFLIADTIAMCSSLAVAFLCILTTWEDLDFLLNYRKTTRALMWCAYGATSLAFGTGLFTVIAPNTLWLAILILVLCTILPLLSKIIGDWPLLMLRYRLPGLFQKDLVPNI